jgi:predicted DNA-binding transcriptional regulator YafY
MRADRLVSLVLLLQARGRMTARGLAAELGVSVRTVYRDLDGLSASGVPVYSERGPGGGCQLLDGYRFPLRALRPEEAEALLILGVPGALRELGLDNAVTAAHRQIRLTAGLDDGAGTRGSGGTAGSASGSVSGSASCSVPGSVPGSDAEVSAPASLVHLDMPPWFRSLEEVPHLRAVAEALRQRRWLEFRYERDGVRRPSPRVVAPLGLVNKAGIWYLIAGGRSDRITVFRVSRIDAPRMLAESVQRPPGFGLAAFWEQWSREFATSRPQLKVRLRASAQALAGFAEVFGPAVHDALSAASEPDESGWRELTLTFEHELAAAHRLAGFGEHVEVISPRGVRDHLVAAARGILSRYGGSMEPMEPIEPVCESQTRASASPYSSPSTEASG